MQVLHRHLCMLCTIFCYIIVMKPTLLLEPFSQSAYLSQTVIFNCFATGHEVKYQWIIGSGSFPSKVIGINSSTLVIPDVKLSDVNYYTCAASNERGNVSSSANKLNILGMVMILALY